MEVKRRAGKKLRRLGGTKSNSALGLMGSNLGPQILDVDVGSQSYVVGKVPATVFGSFVDRGGT